MTKEELIVNCIEELMPWSRGSTTKIHLVHVYTSTLNPNNTRSVSISYQAYPEIVRCGIYRDAFSGYGETEVEALQECFDRIRRTMNDR